MASNKNENNFIYIFWFIVGLTTYGASFTIYLLVRFKGDVAERFAGQAMIFWLSTAVGGGIGYLIGSSMNKTANVQPQEPQKGTVVTDISVKSVSESEPKKEEGE